jgi:hypothetical protein
VNDVSAILGATLVIVGLLLDTLSLLTLLMHRRRGEKSSGFPLVALILYGPAYLIHGPFFIGYEELAILAIFHVLCQGGPYLFYRRHSHQ